MAGNAFRLDDLKRKLRNLKRLELKIRFGGTRRPGKALIWDDFFDLSETGAGKAKYSLKSIASMDHEAFKSVISDYFSRVYFEYYMENGLAGARRLYDPDALSKLGLRFDADKDEIKKRFRELAKIYHPDAGGDAAMFIELMENYKKLVGDGK